MVNQDKDYITHCTENFSIGFKTSIPHVLRRSQCGQSRDF